MREAIAEKIEALTVELESSLMKRYGSPLLTGGELADAMGFRSIHSLRKHVANGTFPLQTFTISDRRGRFVLVKEIAKWLAEQRVNNEEVLPMGE